jgi:chromosome segregation ATPase
MVESKNIAIDAENKRLLRLTEIMSNYLTLLTPPKKLESELQQFFTEKAKYEETITNQNLTIQTLQTKLQNIPKFENTIKSLQDQLKTLQHQTDGLKDTLNRLPESQSLKDLNVKLQGESKAKDKKLTELTEELKSIEVNYNNFLKEMESFNDVKTELTQLKNQLASEATQNQELRKTLQNERQTIQTLQSEKKGLENALYRLERRLTAKGALRGLSIPVHHLEISADLKGKADTEIQEQIQNMNFELQKRLDRIKELEMRTNELKERLAKSSTHDLQMELQTLKSDLDARKGTIMGYESNQKKLMEQLESLQKRIVELQNKIMVQGKEIDEKNNMVKNLETAVSSGVHDQQAREVIQNLQNQNRDLRNEARESEKTIRSLEKNTKFLQTEMKNQKDQSYKLYSQSKDQLTLIQKLQAALRQGGSSAAGLDLKDLRSASSALGDEGASLDSEIKERDRKIARLESYTTSVKQEIEDLQFQISSRDVKVDELTTILHELKENIANSKAKIIVRPPTMDEYRKTKVKI